MIFSRKRPGYLGDGLRWIVLDAFFELLEAEVYRST